MISVEHARTMAAYNRWQNESIYGAADTLSDAQRKEERGAFFGSIHRTLNHLMWADVIWMSRFDKSIRPPSAKRPAESTAQYPDWMALKEARAAFDGTIAAWADRLNPDWLQGDLTWFSGAAGREITRPAGFLVAHFFNHQTHHRGQVHCLLTQFGAKPSDTDLPMMRT